MRKSKDITLNNFKLFYEELESASKYKRKSKKEKVHGKNFS